MKAHTNAAFQQLVEAWNRRSDARRTNVDIAEDARNQRDIGFARAASVGPFVG